MTVASLLEYELSVITNKLCSYELHCVSGQNSLRPILFKIVFTFTTLGSRKKSSLMFLCVLLEFRQGITILRLVFGDE